MMPAVRRLVAIVIMVTIVVVAGACGSDPGSSGGEKTANPASTKPLSYFQDRVQTLFSGKSYTRPPTTSPKPDAGKTVWVVPYGLSIAAAAVFSAGIQDAGKAIGWHVTVFDGKFDPNTSLAGIRQAIAAKADGIITYGIDCPYVQAALQEAKAAHIPVIGVENYDCSELKPNGPKLQTGIGNYNQGPYSARPAPYSEWTQNIGKTAADLIIVARQGKTKVIDFYENDAQASILEDVGFKQEMALCGGCQIVQTIPFGGGDIGTSLEGKASASLLRHPEADAVNASYDGPVTGGIASAVRSANRLRTLYVAGGEGNPPNVDLVRTNGGQNGGFMAPYDWEGWAAVDTMNRILHGQKAAPNGIGLALWDKDHNMPPRGGRVTPPVDHRPGYLKAWGVK